MLEDFNPQETNPKEEGGHGKADEDEEEQQHRGGIPLQCG